VPALLLLLLLLLMLLLLGLCVGVTAACTSHSVNLERPITPAGWVQNAASEMVTVPQ
jgi:hypothetical protein